MMKLRSTVLVGILGVCALGDTAYAFDSYNTYYKPPSNTIYDIVADSSNFDTLELALKRTGLDVVLRDPSEVLTLFAPTDEAFAKLCEKIGVHSIFDVDVDTLTDIILYHVLEGKYYAKDMVRGTAFIETLEGNSIFITKQYGTIVINDDANVIEADIWADNGVVHVIDAVLLPPEPVVHPTHPPTPPPTEKPYPLLPNIMDVLDADKRFDSLYSCLCDAGLKMAVTDGQDITIFAPTDAAFRSLFQSLGISSCSEVDEPTLTDILMYHVVNELVFAQDLSDGDSLTTLQESSVIIHVQDDYYGVTKVFVNDAEIIDTDILAYNGVIHAIDKVLMPPQPVPYY